MHNLSKYHGAGLPEARGPMQPHRLHRHKAGLGYGCAFTLNSSKQFWTRGTSKPWASAGAKPGGAIEGIALPQTYELTLFTMIV